MNSDKRVYATDKEMLEGLTFLADVTDGARTKHWYRDPRTQTRFLYKQSKLNTFGDYTKEHVSEYVASRLGNLIGIKCVNIYLGDTGILSQVHSEYGELVSFVDISEEFENSFHMSDLQTFDISTLLNKKYNTYYNRVFEMLLFDALIGNSDRHPGNFMCSQLGGFYPLLDNGSSLCAYVREESIPQLMTDKRMFNALMETNSKPVLRVGNRITHKELVKVLKDRDKDLFDNFSLRLEDISTKVKDILEEVSISEQRKKLIIKFIAERATWFNECNIGLCTNLFH